MPWPPKNDPILYRPVFPPHYRAEKVPQRVNGTVVVEASPLVEDNQWILDLAANDPFIVGFVGNLPVGTPEFPGLLDRFSSNRLFRGLRMGGSRLKEGLSQASFMKDLQRLAEKGLSLDVLGSTDMLGDVSQLTLRIPDLRIIIDHVANIPVDGQPAPEAWRRGMDALTPAKNIACKVSGLVEGTGKKDGSAPTSVDFYRPVLDHIWNVFGENRLIYGSNWPVSERFASLHTVEAIVLDYFSKQHPKALDAVFAVNAGHFYRPVSR